MISPKQITFDDLYAKQQKRPGLVVMGCAGDLKTWIVNACDYLTEERIVNGVDKKIIDTVPDKLFDEVAFIVTSGGRIDLVLFFSDHAVSKTNITYLAEWVKDSLHVSMTLAYIHNYNHHHEGGGESKSRRLIH